MLPLLHPEDTDKDFASVPVHEPSPDLSVYPRSYVRHRRNSAVINNPCLDFGHMVSNSHVVNSRRKTSVASNVANTLTIKIL